MRIVVNDIVAVPNSGGVYSVLMDFYNEVLIYNKDHPEVEWYFLLAGDFLDQTDQIKILTFPQIKKSWSKRLIFELFSGKNVINDLKPDVYISLQNTMTLGVDALKKWTYLHQPLPYQQGISFSIFKKKERKMWVYQHLVGKVINFTLKHSNTKVIVQTHWMKNVIQKRKIKKEDNVVILPPSNVNINKLSVSEIPQKNSFFYPATGMPYKNHKLLFEAIRRLENKNLNFEVICTLTTQDVEDLGLKTPQSVKLVGMVSRKNILEWYGSKILVFPSLLETFGLPLLEAKLSNDYILAGDMNFGHEILDGYPNVQFFNVNSVEDLTAKMKKCIVDGVSLKNGFVEKSRAKQSLVTTIMK